MSRVSLVTSASALRKAIGSNAVILTNSAAVVIGSLVTAALGFVYWWLAARLFPPKDVGLASAVISIMGLIGVIGEFGLSTLLVGETLRHKGREHGFILAALLAAFASSAITAVAYVAVMRMLPGAAGKMAEGSLADPVFIFGCAITGLALVLDQAFTGLLKGKWQMGRMVAFAVIKLVLLAAAAGGVWLGGERGIILTWVAGMAASVLLLGGLAWRSGVIVPARPDFALLAPQTRKVIDHHLLNMSTQAPSLILPFLVSVLLSPEANAAFYPAWMIVNIAAQVPATLTTVVYTVAMADPKTAARRLTFSLGLSLIVALATGVLFLMFSQAILGVFNPAYPRIAGSGLRLLGFGLLGVLVKHHYIAVVRLGDRMRKGALVFTFGGALELGLAAAGMHFSGLHGLEVGWMLALAVEVALMLKPVLDAGLKKGRNGGEAA